MEENPRQDEGSMTSKRRAIILQVIRGLPILWFVAVIFIHVALNNHYYGLLDKDLEGRLVQPQYVIHEDGTAGAHGLQEIKGNVISKVAGSFWWRLARWGMLSPYYLLGPGGIKHHHGLEKLPSLNPANPTPLLVLLFTIPFAIFAHKHLRAANLSKPQ